MSVKKLILVASVAVMVMFSGSVVAAGCAYSEIDGKAMSHNQKIRWTRIAKIAFGKIDMNVGGCSEDYCQGTLSFVISSGKRIPLPYPIFRRMTINFAKRENSMELLKKIFFNNLQYNNEVMSVFISRIAVNALLNMCLNFTRVDGNYYYLD